MIDAQMHILITDLDNTLYDFAAYFEAGADALISSLAVTLDVDTDVVVSEMRDAFAISGSVEYPFAVESVVRAVGTPPGLAHLATRRALHAFWDAASAQLVAYPSVYSTLRDLHRSKVPVVGVTDAPIHEATRRLGHLRLLPFFSQLTAREWFQPRERGTALVQLRDVPGYRSLSSREVRTVGSEHRKPNPVVYAQVLERFGVSAERAVVIGDSLDRDLAPAVALGAWPVLAAYGRRRFDRETWLPRLVPSVLPEVTRQVVPEDIRQIHDFGEIRRLFAVQQTIAESDQVDEN